MVASEPILKNRYEVIVIGAGVGGLAAAAVLAHEGLEVLVLEKAGKPGGCCSSFKVGDFTFDTAASILQGFGELGFHVQRTLFDFVGQQVDLIPRDSAYEMFFGDEPIVFHRDRQAFTADLGAMFPSQAGSLLSFIRELEDIYHAFLDCSGPPRPRGEDSGFSRTGMLVRHPGSAMRLAKYGRMSAERVLAKHVDDPMVRAFFDADVSFYTGYRLAELSAPHLALAVIDRHIGGTHHAIGSAQRVPDRLEKSIVERGGRVEYRIPVERILYEGDRATGVEVAGGRRISSDVVISDVSARELLGRLMPRETLKPATQEWLEALTPASSAFAIYLGVPEDVIPEGFNPNTVVVDDPERDPSRFISVSVPSLFDPNLSPEGYHCISIHAVTDPAIWPRAADPAYRSDQYEDNKQEEATKVLTRLAPLIPGIMGEPVTWRIASPTTFERIIGREAGAFAAPYPAGSLVPASLPGAVTDLAGLFIAGDSTFYGRGVAEATASGINAASTAMRYLSLHPPRFGPEKESFVIETVPVRPEISSQMVVDSISAVLESHRCMQCDDAPCARACPAGIDIPNVIRRIGCNDAAGAARLVREMNPLGEVCGYICPADSLCEAACVRKDMDAPVQIGQLEAFICGVAQGAEGWPAPFRGARRERVAVVGSGPAGISCAYYLSLLGFNVEVFEEGIEAGGLPGHAMTRSRLHKQILERELEGSLMSGVEFRGNTVFGDDIDFDSLLREGFRAVFLGTGLQSIRMPSVKGIDMPGVIDALSFLGAARRQVKRELASHVAVIGGSSMAIDTAVLAHEMGAEVVYLVSREAPGGEHVSAERVQEAAEAGVTIAPNRKVIEIIGDGRVEALRTHASGEPAGIEGEELPGTLEVGTVIVAWEQEGDPALSGYLSGHLELGEAGRVTVDEDMMTSRQGVFAGGDLTGEGGLVVKACADGRRAALGIASYLDSKSGHAASSQSSRPQQGQESSSSWEPGFFDRDEAS